MKKLLLLALLGVLAVPVVLLYRVRVAEAAWASSFGSLDDIPRRFAAAENSTAAELPKWEARLFPDLRVRGRIGDYLIEEESNPAGAPHPNDYVLNYRRADVDRFAEWIETNPRPVWERSFADPGAAIPNRLPILQFEKLLVAAAMARDAAGDRNGALRLLDAAWKLNESLCESQVLIEQLIAMSNFRYQLGALRKMDADEIQWLPRLRRIDFVKSIAVSEEAWAWHADRMVRNNVYADESYLSSERALWAGLGKTIEYKPRWLELLRTPVRWFDLPSILEAKRQMLLVVSTAPRSEMIDVALDGAYRRGFRRWSYIPDADVARENVATAYRRAARTLAERELTEKVMLARATRRATGKWPVTIDPSSVIADAHWVYERTPSGAAIHLSREIDWGLPLGMQVPLRCELE